MQRILSIAIDESMEELAEMDPRVVSAYMHSMACVIEWTATGDTSVLPPELIPIFSAIGQDAVVSQPEEIPDDSEVVEAELVD